MARVLMEQAWQRSAHDSFSCPCILHKKISTALKRIAQYIYLQYLPFCISGRRIPLHPHHLRGHHYHHQQICWEEAEEQVGSLLSLLPSSTSEEVVGSWFNTTDVDDGNDGNGRWVAGSIQAWWASISSKLATLLSCGCCPSNFQSSKHEQKDKRYVPIQLLYSGLWFMVFHFSLLLHIWVATSISTIAQWEHFRV